MGRLPDKLILITDAHPIDRESALLQVEELGYEAHSVENVAPIVETVSRSALARLAEWKAGFGERVARELLVEVMKGIEAALADLETELHNRNKKTACAVAHRLKGISLNLYAIGNASLTGQIENDLQDENWDSATEHFLMLKRAVEADKIACDLACVEVTFGAPEGNNGKVS